MILVALEIDLAIVISRVVDRHSLAYGADFKIATFLQLISGCEMQNGYCEMYTHGVIIMGFKMVANSFEIEQIKKIVNFKTTFFE